MDKKKTLIASAIVTLCAWLLPLLSLDAQDISKVKFCGSRYEYGQGKDSITLFLKLVDDEGGRPALRINDLNRFLTLYENGQEIVPERRDIRAQRGIPEGFTFSVLVDLGVPRDGKEKIYDAIKSLVESTPDSSVFLSFFGDDVSATQVVTRKNYADSHELFNRGAMRKFFYSALYSKLLEMAADDARNQVGALAVGYTDNVEIANRASANPDKNIMFVFTDSSEGPDDDDIIRYIDVSTYQENTLHIGPRIFAFYYNSGNGLNDDVELTLRAITEAEKLPKDRLGKYEPSDDMGKILEDFSQSVEDEMYDFALTYKATKDMSYQGKIVYQAKWGVETVGEASYSVGSPENPWPQQTDTASGTLFKYFMALFVTFLTMAFFFSVMKILIPFVKSKNFTVKYYKKYVPEAGVQKRVCHFCKQPILPGQMVVDKCKHIMHVNCWQQNEYHCAEYGQNCKTGIQEHVDWQNLLTWQSIRDCQQTLTGIMAGLVSWVVYELMGRGSFVSLSEGIVNMFLTSKAQHNLLFATAVTKVSAFLTIGLLLGFFLSLIFRWSDEYRKKDISVYLKIVGLSLLSAVIGMAAMAVGGIILCMMLSSLDTTYIPWYCSLPAYLLFSVCAALSLTVKSSIPVKSAMLGGLCSAVIGFLVLYISSTSSSRYPWMNMLLDFVIYGGGLGASLVTVRMLAEKYFLVITNGIRAGLRIPIHKWMNATGGGNKVTIGMTGECEIQMNWDKSNKVAKEHAVLYIDQARTVPVIKPMALGVVYNTRAELPVNKASVLTNGDTFKIGDTIFQYVETD